MPKQTSISKFDDNTIELKHTITDTVTETFIYDDLVANLKAAKDAKLKMIINADAAIAAAQALVDEANSLGVVATTPI